MVGGLPDKEKERALPLLYHLVPLWSSASNIRPIIKILYLQQWSITQGAVHTNPLFLSRYRDQRRTWSCKIAQILQTFHLFCIKPKINLLCDIFHYHKTPPRQRFPPKYCSPDSTLCWYHWFQIHNIRKMVNWNIIFILRNYNFSLGEKNYLPTNGFSITTADRSTP